MTKREFDAQTKLNYGCFYGERVAYRLERGHDYYGRDKLAERAYFRRHNPHVPTLSLASPLRAPAEWRLLGRFPRLPYTREELLALCGGYREIQASLSS